MSEKALFGLDRPKEQQQQQGSCALRYLALAWNLLLEREGVEEQRNVGSDDLFVVFEECVDCLKKIFVIVLFWNL